MIPVLLKPRLLGLKNQWRSGARGRLRRGRDFVVLFFSLLIIITIYRGTSTALQTLQENAHLAYLHPSLPIGLLFMLLMAMLSFSNAVAALSILYMGSDLDLILSAPVTTWRLVSAKVIQISLSSSWMALIFGIPVLVAFGRAYNAGSMFYLLMIAVLVPLFLIPSTLAAIAVTLFTRYVPVNRTKEILLLVSAMALFGLYYLIHLSSSTGKSLSDVDEILRMVSFLGAPHRIWMPSHWAAVCLGEVLESSGRNWSAHLTMLYSVALFCASSVYLVLRGMYFSSYSKSKSAKQGVYLQSQRSQDRLRALTPFLSQPVRAMCAKELKCFARDMTQALQLLLLIGLCMIYLYNFKLLQIVDGLPLGTQLWWKAVLLLLNLIMGSFVITAVCTRFVFPSVSLEGRSFWILATSPLAPTKFLKTKFMMWLLPIGCIANVIFVSGALAINAEPIVILLSGLASWIFSYGIVGLGIGLGTLFSDFEWEHASQLSASLGSLLYMLASMVLIVLNLIPISALVFLKTFKAFGSSMTYSDWIAFVIGASAIVLYLNIAITRWALQAGVKALTLKQFE